MIERRLEDSWAGPTVSPVARWLTCMLLVLASACARLPRPILLPADIAAQDLIRLGQVYQAQGKSELALQTYHKALEINPRYVPAWVELGNLHYLRQESGPAEAVYKKVLTLDPRMAEIYNNLCWVYLQEQRNLDEAESLIQRALALNPTSRYLFLDTQAVIWTRQGRYEQALASLTEAIRLTPSAAHEVLAEEYEHLADVYGPLGQEGDAQWAREQAAMARRAGG
jgi:tetratricopeptide (TPR) repeat protein